MKKILTTAILVGMITCLIEGATTPLNISLLPNLSLFREPTVVGLDVGIISKAKSVYGLNVSLCSHIENMYGVQIGAYISGAIRGVGLQVSGIGPNITKNFTGVNFCISGNISEEFKGIQISVFNLGHPELQPLKYNPIDKFIGIQVGFGANYVNKFYGIQLGFINYAENLNGIQIGVINIAKNSLIPYMIGINVGW